MSPVQEVPIELREGEMVFLDFPSADMARVRMMICQQTHRGAGRQLFYGELARSF